MKFAHDYVQSLDEEAYPPQWVQSAISYRQLKKCIKKVRNELLALGLRPDVLNLLWRPSESGDNGCSETSRRFGFHYYLANTSEPVLTPKLTFVIDSRDGTPVDAFLSPETRSCLDPLLLVAGCDNESRLDGENVVQRGDTGMELSRLRTVPEADKEGSHFRTVEIPLYSDSEFFRILKEELSALDDLREREQTDLSGQVADLRKDLSKIVNKSLGRKDIILQAWREIFRQYLDLQIFFSTDETNSGARNSEQATQQLVKFQSTLKKENSVRKLKKDSRVALEAFMRINNALLQNLKFQEINRVALTKILKKFDKRTALHARSFFPQIVSTEPFLTQTVAKAICYSMSEEVLSLVPQLNDYLCPICFSVAFKPVRLRCNHVFCIRCLVVMQRARQNQCALCRENAVMEASGENLDQELLAFLQATFPKETKIKQRENERAAAIDLYGDSYDTCRVM